MAHFADVVRYKGQLYFTEDESPPDPQPLAGSFIEFFINGASQGRTYVDAIKEGTYYPALSIYTHAPAMPFAILSYGPFSVARGCNKKEAFHRQHLHLSGERL